VDDARLNLMEYRGIRYTIRVAVERGQWLAVIHPDEDVEVGGRNKIIGTREDAEIQAHRMIDKWLDPKSRQKNKQLDERRQRLSIKLT